jgi:hypothetical protein
MWVNAGVRPEFLWWDIFWRRSSMSTRPSPLDSASLLDTLKKRIMSLASGLARSSAAYRADPEIMEEIARDLNLQVTELYALAAGDGNKLTALLDKRLESLDLREDEIIKAYPKVMWDLQRVCGNCTSTRVCAEDFAGTSRMDGIPDYCPNAQTLQSILRDRRH